MKFRSQVKDSILNMAAYGGFSKMPLSFALKYLLKITLLVGLLWMILPTWILNQDIDNFRNDFMERVPDFVLENGELIVKSEMPAIYNENDLLVIVDTSGYLKDDVLDQFDKGIFINKNTLFYKNSYAVISIDLGKFYQVILNKAVIYSWLPYLKFILPVYFILGLVYYFLAKLVTAFLIGIIGLIMSKLQYGKLRFGSVFNITVFALTLPVIFQLLNSVQGIMFFGPIYYGFLLLYLWFAIKSAILNNETEEARVIT